MTVTEIRPISKRKSRVRLEDGNVLVLYQTELKRYHMEEAQEVADQDYETLVRVILPGRAKRRALHLLTRQDYTEKQLRDKLIRQGYSSAIADEAVSYAGAYRYVDDLRYAKNFISCHKEKKSCREMEQRLMQKGIGRETIRQAFTEVGSEEDFWEEEKVIRKILEKKYSFAQSLDIKEKQRIFACLCRKGFSCEGIKRAMEHSNT